MIELRFVRAWVRDRVGKVRESGDDAGLSTLEWVALCGVIIIAAIVVATILMTKAKTAAHDVNVE